MMPSWGSVGMWDRANVHNPYLQCKGLEPAEFHKRHVRYMGPYVGMFRLLVGEGMNPKDARTPLDSCS
jgi:hypothetical protein